MYRAPRAPVGFIPPRRDLWLIVDALLRHVDCQAAVHVTYMA